MDRRVPQNIAGDDDNLHQWATRGELKEVQKCLAAPGGQAGKHRENERGELPFHCAARCGHLDVMEALLPNDVNARAAGLQNMAALHCVAAGNHVGALKWLVQQKGLAVDAQDDEGRTPLHVAALMGHHEIVKELVCAGAHLCRKSKHGLMPISCCQDAEMFRAFVAFPAFTRYDRDSVRRMNAQLDVYAKDANERTIVHYAAEFGTTEVFAKLLAVGAVKQDIMFAKDAQGLTPLHLAAKAGNTHVLAALKKASFHLSSQDDHKRMLHGPSGLGLMTYALFQNHKAAFQQTLALVANASITLDSILKGLVRQLLHHSDMDLMELVLFAATLPTYLALYADKPLAFELMVDRTDLTVNQYDDRFKRTCLHWGVVHKKKHIVDKLLNYPDVKPGIEDAEGKTAMQHAFEQKDHAITQVLLGREDFRAYEEKLYKDREVYMQGLNAILVGAVLVASVTFAGWLQLPSTEFGLTSMKVFWGANSLSFFAATATVSMCVGALLPTPKKYVGAIVRQLRITLVLAATLLTLCLAVALVAFSAAGFAAAPHLGEQATVSLYDAFMRNAVPAGGFLCAVMWLWLFVQLFHCAPSLGVVLKPLLKPLSTCASARVPGCGALANRVTSRVGASARFGYDSVPRTRLREDLTRNLLDDPHSASQGPRELPDGWKEKLQGLQVEDRDTFIHDQELAQSTAPEAPRLDAFKEKERLKDVLEQE